MAPISKDHMIKHLERVFFKSFIVNEVIEAAHFFVEIHASMPLLQEKRIKELEKEFSSEERSADEYWEARQILEGRFQYGMPRVLYWSYLIFLCGLIETKIRAIANILADHKGVSLEEWLEPQKPTKKPRGSNIEKYRRFIADNSNLDICDVAEWNFLCDLVYVRNCLVHSAGQLSKKKEERDRFIDIAKRHVGLNCTDPNWSELSAKLIITEDFCALATIKLQDFFDDLYGKLEGGSIIPVRMYQGIY